MSSLHDSLLELLSRNWWLLLLRGVAAIAFAVLSWAQPGLTLSALILLFGAYALVDGVLGIWSAFAARKKHRQGWLLLLGGLFSLAAGVATFVMPGVTALALLIYIAIWAIGIGAMQLVAAVRLRKEIEGEWLLGLNGLLSIALGAWLLAQPGAGILALLWVLAAYALLAGIVLVVLAFRLRKLGKGLAPA